MKTTLAILVLLGLAVAEDTTAPTTTTDTAAEPSSTGIAGEWAGDYGNVDQYYGGADGDLGWGFGTDYYNSAYKWDNYYDASAWGDYTAADWTGSGTPSALYYDEYYGEYYGDDTYDYTYEPTPYDDSYDSYNYDYDYEEVDESGMQSGNYTDTYEEYWETAEISVDTGKLNDLVQDWLDFKKLERKETKQELNDLLEAIGSAFTHTKAKMILNFGKTIPPLAQKWGELFKYVAVNDECDQECVAACFDPWSANDFYINEECMTSCNCQFAFEAPDANQTDIQVKAQETEEAAMVAAGSIAQRWQEFAQEVGPAAQAYCDAKKKLNSQFAELVKEHAVRDFGCDEQCVNDCTEMGTKVSIDYTPQCLEWCWCEQQIFTIAPVYEEEEYNWETTEDWETTPTTEETPAPTADYNYAALLKYSGYDMKAWSYFMRQTQ